MQIMYIADMFDPADIALHWVNRLSFLSRRALMDVFHQAGHKISAEEWAVLLMLWKSDGQGPGEISAQSMRDATTVTRLVDGMVRKGVVTRRESKKDRRRSEIWLTEMGRALQPELIALAMPVIGISLTGISASDMEVALRVLKQMTQNLQEAADKPGE